MHSTAFTAAPQRRILTPFNMIAGMILAIGIPVMAYRFLCGLGAATNLTDNYPWGLWIGFDVLCGVALAAGGYTCASAVYVFGLKEYKPIVRPAILTGFLGYFFVVVGLLFDLGRPWRLPYPMFVSFGVTSVMFLVAWHVALYLTCQFVEFSPAVFEWLGWRRIRQIAAGLTVGATIFGVILSTLHQSALGALFLLAPTKLHPLWYSPFLPLFFFVSSVIAGIAMIIIESTLSHRFFRDQVDPDKPVDLDKLTLGLARAGGVVMFVYFALKLLGVAHGSDWYLLGTPYGHLFLAEMFVFVLLPGYLFILGSQLKNVKLVRWTAVLAVLGIVLNRLTVSILAFNWNIHPRYVPHWMEIVVSLAIVTIGVLTFRWIVDRMPVLHAHPDFPSGH
jgi:Ni/Fe-hydrogenase subunit HybB-like protein